MSARARIAELLDADDVDPMIASIGTPVLPTVPAAVGQGVQKHGRTTGHTRGSVVDVSFSGYVQYPRHRAWFDDQIGVAGTSGPFSLPGDSGSLIVDDTNHPVSLLFAGDENQTLGNSIDEVLNAFSAIPAFVSMRSAGKPPSSNTSDHVTGAPITASPSPSCLHPAFKQAIGLRRVPSRRKRHRCRRERSRTLPTTAPVQQHPPPWPCAVPSLRLCARLAPQTRPRPPAT